MPGRLRGRERGGDGRRCDVCRKANAHVKCRVSFPQRDRSRLHQKLKQRGNRPRGRNLINKRLFQAHQFTPAVASDMGHIVELHVGLLTLNNKIHVDRRSRQQRLTVSALVAVADRGLITLR